MQNILATVVISGAIALLAAWARHKAKAWIHVATTGLIVFSCLVVVFSALRFNQLTSKREPIPDDADIVQVLKAWFDQFHVSVERQDSKDKTFLLVVTMHSGKKVEVFQTTSDPGFVIFQAGLTVADPDQLSRMSPRDRELTIGDIRRSLLMSNVVFQNLYYPFSNVKVSTPVPIGSLTEQSTLDAMVRAEGGLDLIEEVLKAHLLNTGLISPIRQ